MAAVPICVSFVRTFSFFRYGSGGGSLTRLSLSRCERNSFSSGSASPVSENKSSEEEASITEENRDQSKHESERRALEDKINDLDDKYKRALAENENVRQRMQRQIADAKLFGIQGFCKDLLEVADILQSATNTVPSEELNETNRHLKNLFDGLCMTETQLQKVFRTHGLTQINPIGEKFNPNMHEALFEQPVEGKEPGTVAVVTKIGYKLHDRTIRPALVGIVKSLS